MDLVIENLTPSGRNLLPNVISIEAHNFVKFSPYGSITDEHNHEFNHTYIYIITPSARCRPTYKMLLSTSRRRPAFPR